MAQKKNSNQSSNSPTSGGYGLGTLIELSQQTAVGSLRSAVQAQKAADRMVSALVEAGAASQQAGLNIAVAYVESLNKVRQGWVEQAAEVSEQLLNLSPLEFDYPFRSEVESYNAAILEQSRKAFDVFTAPFRAAMGL